MQVRIAAVDLVSNTCFPALAAEELGFFKAQGLDAHIELVAALGATKALRDGTADAMIAGSVHDLLTEFPRWEGAKLIRDGVGDGVGSWILYFTYHSQLSP